MKHTMEESVTVVKIPHEDFSLMCIRCSTSLDEEWEYCPQCGRRLNVGLQ